MADHAITEAAHLQMAQAAEHIAPGEPARYKRASTLHPGDVVGNEHARWYVVLEQPEGSPASPLRVTVQVAGPFTGDDGEWLRRTNTYEAGTVLPILDTVTHPLED